MERGGHGWVNVVFLVFFLYLMIAVVILTRIACRECVINGTEGERGPIEAKDFDGTRFRLVVRFFFLSLSPVSVPFGNVEE